MRLCSNSAIIMPIWFQWIARIDHAESLFPLVLNSFFHFLPRIESHRFAYNRLSSTVWSAWAYDWVLTATRHQFKSCVDWFFSLFLYSIILEFTFFFFFIQPLFWLDYRAMKGTGWRDQNFFASFSSTLLFIQDIAVESAWARSSATYKGTHPQLIYVFSGGVGFYRSRNIWENGKCNCFVFRLLESIDDFDNSNVCFNSCLCNLSFEIVPAYWTCSPLSRSVVQCTGMFTLAKNFK